jgi:hypothetical protein
MGDGRIMLNGSLRETGCVSVDCTHLAHDESSGGSYEPSRSIKRFEDSLSCTVFVCDKGQTFVTGI